MSIGSIQGLGRLDITAFSSTRSGTVSDQRNGQGTFRRTITAPGDTSSVNTTVSFAHGITLTRDITSTYNANGSITRAITSTGPNGKTYTRDETITPGSNGSGSITGSIIGPNGAVDTFTGTRVSHGGSSTSNVTLTDAAGKTAIESFATAVSGASTTYVTSATNFAGKLYSDATTTIAQSPSAAGVTA